MKTERNKYLAIIAALAAVGWFFWHETGDMILKDLSITPSVSSSVVTIVPTATTTPEGQSALEEGWSVFSAYRTAVETRDLAALAHLTYKLSPACQAALGGDKAQLSTCQGAMDSVSLFTKNFVKGDFTEVASDARQIVMSTGYIANEAQGATVRTVLYFLRTSGGTKIAGIRICLDQDRTSNECMIEKEGDSNGNGIWDDVEYFTGATSSQAN